MLTIMLVAWKLIIAVGNKIEILRVENHDTDTGLVLW